MNAKQLMYDRAAWKAALLVRGLACDRAVDFGLRHSSKRCCFAKGGTCISFCTNRGHLRYDNALP